MGVNEPAEGYLLWLTLGEVVLLCWLATLLGASIFGSGGFLAETGRGLRIAALAVVLAEIAVPVWILLDVRRRDVDSVWVHVAAMPLVNLFGLAAYLEERKHASKK